MLTIGIRISKLRELRGYSQNYMAKKLGISQAQYSYLETKQKNIDDEQIKAIALLIGVKEDYIRTFDPQNFIEHSPNASIEEFLNIQNQLIENYEKERKLFLELISKLKKELEELKNRGGDLKIIS
jgi:XRE family transcriptional regulator, regulator of sulfur utilization